MSSNSASAVGFTRQDARVLGRALHREDGFEARQTVNDRLLAEVERVRSLGSVAQAEGAPAKRRPSAKGARRSARASSPKAAKKDAGATRRGASTRSRTSKPEDTPSTNGVPAVLDKLLAAFNGAIDWLFGLHGVAKAGLIALATVGVLFLFFYQPAASLWAAHRDHDQLLAQQQALTEMSNELEGRIAELQTEEGIMDEARVRGYAPAGEIAADASELVGEDDDGIIAVLGQAPEETEDSPLTQALDVFFGYQKRA